MNTSQDQKDMYQVPTTLSVESSSALSPVGEIESDRDITTEQLVTVERQHVIDAFGQIVRSDDMHDMWHETRSLPQIETVRPHPTAVELSQVSAEIRQHRDAHLASVAESERISTMVGKIVTRLFSESPLRASRDPISHFIEQEHKLASTKIFPKDRDVTELKFFYLPDGNLDIWYHSQVSPIQSKNFTNSYTVRRTGVEKSATFYDEQQSRMANVSVMADETEMQNLLRASKLYAEIVKEMYRKKSASRRKFGSRNDHDLAA